MFNLLVKIPVEQESFLEKVRAAMECSFGDDQKRVDHALQVFRYAKELLIFIEADPVLTLTAAYLHDIGIHEAERKHGSNAGRWQELEGPPIAASILAELGAEATFIDLVTGIIGHHHTRGGVDSPEFRIVWDADAMVNFAGALTSRTDEQVEEILRNHMVTAPGFSLARKLFMTDAEGHRRWSSVY